LAFIFEGVLTLQVSEKLIAPHFLMHSNRKVIYDNFKPTLKRRKVVEIPLLLNSLTIFFNKFRLFN